MKNLIIFVLTAALLIFLTSCGVVKEGFGSPKKENSDEFLVEKKMPLKMPPNFKDLPKPETINSENKDKKNEIKSLLSKVDESDDSSTGKKEIVNDFKKLLLKKIKDN